jgi:beta-lactamase regulating signal transducer with metallopeptidase domain
MINLLIENWNGWAYAFAWSMVASLWQFLLVGMALKVILWLSPNQHSNWRYHISLGALVFCVGLWWTNVAGYLSEYHINSENTVISIQNDALIADDAVTLHPVIPETTDFSNENIITETENITTEKTLQTTITDWVSRYKIGLSIGWLIGVLALLTRLLGSWFYLRTLRMKGIEAIDNQYLNLFKTLQNRLNINTKVDLYLSKLVKEPITFGYLKPIVLIPIGLINQLSEQEVEAILLHELAHIKRNDFLINIIQNCIEITLFYHPVIWWISNQVREIREECCDDMAISIQKNKTTYAATLVQVQRYSYSLTSKIKLVMAATGKKGQLTQRIHRLFTEKTAKKQRGISFPLILLTLVVGSFSLLAFQYIQQEEPTVSISLDKMNILYVGLENPITVALEGYSNDEITVTSNDVTLTPTEHGKYIAVPKELGQVRIVVSTRDISKSMFFEVVEVPSLRPVPDGNVSKDVKDGHTSIVTPKEMQEMKGIKTELQEEYGYTCEVVGFELTRVPKSDDPITERNNASNFKGRVINLVKLAKSGDIYYVDQIKAKCPGDEEARYLNGLIFKVK